MLTTLVVNLTAGLILLNVAGIHSTPWWSIAVMFFGYGFVRSVVRYGAHLKAMEELEQQADEEEKAHKAFMDIIQQAREEAAEEKEIQSRDKKDLH